MSVTVTPERLELYRRIAEVSAGGKPLMEQAKELGIRYEQLKHLRFKAMVHGFDVKPLPRGGHNGRSEYWSMEDDAVEAAKVDRCQCGLALPCDHSSLYELWRSGNSSTGL